MQYEITGEKYARDVMAGSLDTVSRNADSLLRIFADSVVKNTVPETWNFYKSGMDKMEALSNYLELDVNEEKQRVYYFAVMKTVLELGDMLNRKLEEQSEQQEYKNYKYVYPILGILADSGGLSVCKLAEKLDISRNSLANSIKRTDKFGLWRMEHRGRNRYYFITAKGKRAYQYYCVQGIASDNASVEKIILYVLELVGNELEKETPDPSNIIHLLNQRYNKGISVSSSEVFKMKLKEVVFKAERGVYKKKRKMNRYQEREADRDFPLIYDEYYVDDAMEYQYGAVNVYEVIN